MTDDQIKHMAQRFLSWKLPDPFRPDNGISFTPPFPDEPMRSRHWPVGTNLLGASKKQMTSMIDFLLAFGAEHHIRWSEPMERAA